MLTGLRAEEKYSATLTGKCSLFYSSRNVWNLTFRHPLKTSNSIILDSSAWTAPVEGSLVAPLREGRTPSRWCFPPAAPPGGRILQT